MPAHLHRAPWSQDLHLSQNLHRVYTRVELGVGREV